MSNEYWRNGDKPPTTSEMVAVLIEGLKYPDIARFDQKTREWVYEGYDKRVKQSDFRVAYYHFLSSPPNPFSL